MSIYWKILLDNTKPERDNHCRACFYSSLSHLPLPDDPFLTYDASARNISIYLLLGQTRRDPRGCSNEISNSPWKLGRHWKWIERANNAEQGVACSSVKWRSDEWRRDLRRDLCASDGRRGSNSDELKHTSTYVQNTILRHSREMLGTPSIIPRALLICLIHCFYSAAHYRPEMFKNNPDKFDTRSYLCF